jgi:aryl-alcohol dehydrogenase-like predicted oxidoreductase
LKLGLGTVQFGMDYGISNQHGKIPFEEVKAILKFAQENGVDVIDTACSYGESESVLGRALSNEHGFRLITKTPFFKRKQVFVDDASIIKDTFYGSLRKLGQSKIAGLLTHHADDLLSGGGDILYNALQELKNEGIVEKLGVSVYTGEQIDLLLKRYTFDLIQVPVNILDQRLINNYYLKKLKEQNIEIHARSVFLQGLLLIDPEQLHSFFNPIKPLLFKYRQFLNSHGLSPIEGSLGFVKGIPEIDYLIIGVNNLEQLKDNLQYFNRTYNDSLFSTFKEFSINDLNYLNPYLWKIN